MWKIELLIETDEEERVERLSDQITALACDEPMEAGAHTCRLPWLLITSGLDDEQAAGRRDELNR